MHEVAIAEEIKAVVLVKIKEHKAKKVIRVKIVAGELTSIVPEALTFAFEAVSAGTPMQGAKIEIQTVKMRAECRKCSKKFRVKDFNYICPGCGSTAVKLTAGKELIVQTIDME